MGVSRAATSLRQMVGEQVLLSVPAVNIVTRQAASGLVERGGSSKLVAVQQSFEGPFSGTRSVDLSASPKPGARPVDRGRRSTR